VLNLWRWKKLGLKVDVYDATKTLVINPIIWSTYFGGEASEFSTSLASDSRGDIYIVGRTFSAIGIATAGAFQTTRSESAGQDCFLAKYSPSGCNGDTGYLNITISKPLGSESFSWNDEMQLYPNPSAGILHLRDGLNRALTISIQNTLGEQVYRSQLEPDGSIDFKCAKQRPIPNKAEHSRG